MSIRQLETSAGGQTVEGTLTAIAQAAFGVSRFSGHRALCHATVATAVKQRNVDSDVVVLLGWRTPETVLHSVLVDARGSVVADTMPSGRLSSDTYAHGGDTLDVLIRISVYRLKELA